MDRAHDLGARPARLPVPRASCRLPQRRRLLRGVSARPPPGPPLSCCHLTSSGSRGARERAAQVQRKYCRHRAPRPSPSKQPAPCLPPEPGALAPGLLCPSTVRCSQIAPFSTQPTQGQDAGSLGSVQRVASWPPRPTIRLPERGGRRGGWGEGGGGRLARSPSPPCLL